MTLTLAYLLIIVIYFSESALEKFPLVLTHGFVKLVNGILMPTVRDSRNKEEITDEPIADQVGLGYPTVVGRTPYGSIRLSHCGGAGTWGFRKGRVLRAGIVAGAGSLYPKTVCT